MNLPFSQASESNKNPILGVIRHWFKPGQMVLEIGSGTGQHAAYFAECLPGVIWQCADQPEYHATINQRVKLAALPNLRTAIELEVSSFDWSLIQVNHVFTANTAHIMSWTAVQAMFKGVSKSLLDGVFVQYGPFNCNGDFTSESNRRFHATLTNTSPEMGIRNDADLIAVARENGMALVDDVAMPANNRILIWTRHKAPG